MIHLALLLTSTCAFPHDLDSHADFELRAEVLVEDATEATLSIRADEHGGAAAVLRLSPELEGWTPGTWHEVRVVCAGASTVASVDDRVVVDVLDAERLSGALVWDCPPEGRVQQRDVSIIDLGRPEWAPLFDGSGTDGWHEIGDADWSLEDGILVGRQVASNSMYGHMVSDEAYMDFAVRVVYRATRGNSGLYFRVVESGFSGVTGFQAEIDPTRLAGGLYETGGRGWVVEPPQEQFERVYRPDDWNTMVVCARGGHVTVDLNGERTAELVDDPGRRAGHFALQAHGGQDVLVEFARVEVLVPRLQRLDVGGVHRPVYDPQFAPRRDRRFDDVRTLDSHAPFDAPEDLASWEVRREDVRRRVLVAAGLWPTPPLGEGSSTVHGAVERDDYTVERVVLDGWPGTRVTGSLYRPRGEADGLRPAVLSPHGHWSQGRFHSASDAEVERALASGWEELECAARHPLQARCVQLARMGCVVFHYDMLGYADSTELGHGGSAGFGDARAELLSQSAFGLQTAHSLRAFEFLAGLPDVDPDRVLVTGASGGGTQTFVLGAIDERPAALFPAVMVSTGMQGGCVCENASHLRVGTGNVELAAMAAPRPLGLTGADDWTRSIDEYGRPDLIRTYALYDATSALEVHVHPDFPHNYNAVSRGEMYAFASRALGLDEPTVERDFAPLTIDEMTVWSPPRLVPEATIEEVRATWTETIEEQLEGLVPTSPGDCAEYERVVAGALRTLIADELPPPGSIADPERRTWQGPTSFVLRREGSSNEVPAAASREPDEWNGVVVVAVSPRGKSDLFGTLARQEFFARDLIDRGCRVLAIDALGCGEAGAGRSLPVDAARHAAYSGYTHGYNRTLLAERVSDVLTAIAWARDLEGCTAVHVVGFEEAGPWVLLASALAGDAVRRTAADWSWDFDDVDEASDERFLPGALRFGGLDGLTALVAPRGLRVLGRDEVPETTARCYAALGVENRARAVPAGRWARIVDWFATAP